MCRKAGASEKNCCESESLIYIFIVMTQIIGLVIALVAAILVAQDAKKRGMNPIGWAIGVFLLLIIFLPVYFIVRKPKLEE